MAKKVKISISVDKKFLAELDKAIEKYSLANRSALFRKWAEEGFEQLKKDHGIKKKLEIVPEVR